jgi:hypothetical protein
VARRDEGYVDDTPQKPNFIARLFGAKDATEEEK